MACCIGATLFACGAEAGATAFGSAITAVAVGPRVDRELTAASVLVAERGGGREETDSALPWKDRQSRAVDALAVAIAITGLLTMVFGIGERRWRQLAGLALLLLGMALYGGCDPGRSLLRAPKASASRSAWVPPWAPASA